MEILGYIAAAITLFGAVLATIKWLRKRRHKAVAHEELNLPNRDELVRAIHEVTSIAITLLVRIRQLNQIKRESPYRIDTDLTQDLDEANVAYLAAREKLSQEKLVAGYAFREPISDFIVCIMEQFEERSELRPDDASGIIDINLKAEDTVERIDAIASG